MEQLPSYCHGNTVISIEQKLSLKVSWKFSCMQFCTQAQGGVTTMGPATSLAHTSWPREKKQKTAEHKVNLICFGI